MNWREELEALERDKRWGDAMALMEKISGEPPPDAEAYVRAIYLLLNLLLEEDYDAHDLAHDDLAARLQRYFDHSYGMFNDNPEYLFFIGYFMGLAEWYFGQDTLELSHRMLRKATEIAPDNVLYDWAYKFVSGDGAADRLAGRLTSNAEVMKWLESKGAPGAYMINVIRACSENRVDKTQD